MRRLVVFNVDFIPVFESQIMTAIEPKHFVGKVFNVVDGEKFKQGLQLIRESLFDQGRTIYAADNVITWNRNLSFMRDEFFQENFLKSEKSDTEKSLMWRRYVLLYFANFCKSLEGDYLELGCYEGVGAETVIRRLDFGSLGKNYYLYDLFEWNEGDKHSHLAAHRTGTMYEDVVRRFSAYPFVKIVKGFVPQSFEQGFPEKIAFAHIDMNNHVPEAGALERVLPNLVKGGAIVFDDYGWWGYSQQKAALDPIAMKHGLSILELPTGQGLLLKS